MKSPFSYVFGAGLLLIVTILVYSLGASGIKILAPKPAGYVQTTQSGDDVLNVVIGSLSGQLWEYLLKRFRAGTLSFDDLYQLNLTAPPFSTRGYNIPQRFLDVVTTKTDTHVLFNIRRYTDSKGMVIETLYAIIPNFKPHECTFTTTNRRGVVFGPYQVNTGLSSLRLSPDNRTVINDDYDLHPLSWFGSPCCTCAHSLLGQYYFLIRVIGRAKGPNDKAWQIL